MLSFFRRKTPTTPFEKSFKERVAEFWETFANAAPRFLATIDAHRCADLEQETSSMVDKLSPELAWVYGPGANNQGHSLTITGEGIEHRQLLARYWLSQAPEIPGWTFYASRQAGPIKGHVIEIQDLRIDPKEIWVTPSPDHERQKIDLTVWHHAWEHISEKTRWTIVFLFLDEALGEYGTQMWIGELTFGKDRLANSFPLEELAGHVTDTVSNAEWKRGLPGDEWTVFRIKPCEGRHPRWDLISLSTSTPQLFQACMDEKETMPDLLAGAGADYVYVSIERAFFPQGAEVAKRSEVEDALDAALRGQQSGQLIGGGQGTERGYIDFLIFDGSRSLEIVRDVLKELSVPAGTMIEYFARDKRARRIAL